jgi:ribosomal-protein-alanine N-acetyltransferase
MSDPRTIRHDDIPALSALHAVAFPPPGRGWSEAEFLGLFSDPHTFGNCLPEGFILFRLAGGEADLLTLAVHPDSRRRGLGRRLLEGGLAEARERGAEKVFLEVAADNEAAIALYLSAGFTEAARRPRYYPGGRDALVLALEV